MIHETICWIILISSCITAVAAVAGMLSPKFEDSFLQCCALAGVAFGGFIVALQIYIHGVVQVSGVALAFTAIAVYSLATVWKYARKRVVA